MSIRVYISQKYNYESIYNTTHVFLHYHNTLANIIAIFRRTVSHTDDVVYLIIVVVVVLSSGIVSLYRCIRTQL